MTDAALQTYFKFDEAELLENQNGRLSENQKKRLAGNDQSAASTRRFAGIALICIAAGALISVVIGALTWGGGIFEQLFQFFIFGSSVSFFALLAGGLGLYLLRTSSVKNKKYKLRKLQGLISYTRHTNKRTGNQVIGYWIIHVGTAWFYVSEEVPKILIADQAYNVYTYASQGSTHILSAEPVAQAA